MKSFNSWGFLVPPSLIYLLINITWPPFTHYSTVKCENRAILYVQMDIHSHMYLLINDNGPLLALYSTVKCAKGPMYHLLVCISANGYKYLYLLINDTWAPFRTKHY